MMEYVEVKAIHLACAEPISLGRASAKDPCVKIWRVNFRKDLNCLNLEVYLVY